MRKLIINADDFGLHPTVNEAVREGANAGRILSTSFMAAGKAAEEAAEIAGRTRQLGTGIHLTLVAERPVLPTEQVQSLLDREGNFLPDYGAFIKRFSLGKIDLTEVRAECEAQIIKMEKLGLRITHLDSHQHLHVLPKIIDVCLELMKEHEIRCMRVPAEDCMFLGGERPYLPRFLARGVLSCLARCAACKARKNNIRMTDAFYGMLAGGHLDQAHLSAILRQLPEGISEIMLHPGINNRELKQIYNWKYHWQEEWQAVLSGETGRILEEKQIELGSYTLLYEGRTEEEGIFHGNIR